ncbi:hypothetical protein [Micromonospora coerulea]|uniref:hypothetical protein n=1 Tax=Micromonospora coerulea TaxID=47856 RepID=UPI0019086F70|nr:hypothetical protein [Micromonospora veneta]
MTAVASSASDTGIMLRVSPEALAQPFLLLDEGHTAHVRDMDVLLDHPEVISVVRFHFYTGTGYEVLFSGACEADDFAACIALVSRANIVHVEPWGWNASGYAVTRSLHWERSNTYN